ncbi:protein MIX23-like [Tubulanus polymorphus]|uniref:protein MIX23-like n=1 Tax=Tubulanus polymorphus TaxID=672921 RepID=UPI003DA6A486
MASPGSGNSVEGLICEDFQEFQETLKKMRLIDDRLTQALNTTIPTDSFRGKVDATATCKGLHEEMMNSYNRRETMIKKCIREVNSKVMGLRAERDKNPDDLETMKNLRRHQTSVRLMQGELIVEDVIKERSLRLFYERCRAHYKPATPTSTV